MQTSEWRKFNALDKDALINARKQLHQAIQNVAAVGRKFLPHTESDENATLVWVPGLTRMAGKWVEGDLTFRSSINLETLEVLLIDSKVTTLASFPLLGKTHLQLMLWLEEQIGKLGLHAPDLTMNLPYELPKYDTQKGQPFSKEEASHMLELAKYYNNSYICLRNIKVRLKSENTINIWPHHFDQALRITLKDSGDAETDTSISFGMSPGDSEYERPYFYVNTWPHVDTSKCETLDNHAIWVSEEWTGAVLFSKHLVGSAGDQQATVEQFYRQAEEQLISLLVN